VYTNDDRFKIKHNDGAEEWILVIEYVQTRDNGTYECQVKLHLQLFIPYSQLIISDSSPVPSTSPVFGALLVPSIRYHG